LIRHYRQAHGCIIVYDITKQASFNSAKDWLKGRSPVNEEAQDKVPEDCVIMLLANKLDKLEFGNLPKTEQLSFANSIRAVDF
jgi:GTPase SAR1 family protein